MNKKKLIIMVGCPGSGKSTYIKNHLHKFDGYVAVISRDEIRFGLVKENESYFSKEKEVFNKYIEDIKFSLINADTVIADATHLNEGSRSKLLRALGNSLKDVEVIAFVIKTPLNIALEQNELRAGTRAYVPQDAIRRMYSSFTMPTVEEGFDHIYTYQRKKVNL